MKKVFSLLALMLAASGAHAELVLKDLVPGSGDKMVMYDNVSKLEWLRLTATKGKSFDEVRKSSFVTVLKFRPASKTEFTDLFKRAGLVDDGFDVSRSQPNAALALATLLGPTLVTGGGRLSALGMTGTDYLGTGVLPPVGSLFTPLTGKIDLLMGLNLGKGPVNIGEAHYTGGHQASNQRNDAVGTLLVRPCKAVLGNQC